MHARVALRRPDRQYTRCVRNVPEEFYDLPYAGTCGLCFRSLRRKYNVDAAASVDGRIQPARGQFAALDSECLTKETAMTIDKQRPQLRFILNGFTQDKGFRRFAFQSVQADQSRHGVHGSGRSRSNPPIRHPYPGPSTFVPRKLLERRPDSETVRSFTFTEDNMRQHRTDLEAAKQSAARKKKLPRTPAPANAGGAWRTTFQFSLGNRP